MESTNLPHGEPTILMVDDEPTTLEVMDIFLRAAGFSQLVRTSDAREVISLMESAQPDLLLLNLMMPYLDGSELLTAIRSHPQFREVPVIVVTGSTDPEVKRQAVARGATDFLAKPIDPSELTLRVRNTLSASGSLGAESGIEPGAVQPPATPTGDALVSRLGTDDPRSRAIVENFVVRLRAKLAEMEACVDQGELDKLVELAHWLKGAAGTVGFAEFTGPAEALQQLVREAKLDELEPAIAELNELADRIVVDPEAGR